jgi:hypothetical protein
MSFCSFEYFDFLVFLTNGRPVAVATASCEPALEGERREAALAPPLVRATAESSAPVTHCPSGADTAQARAY